MSDKIEFKTLVDEDGTDSGDSTSITKRPGTLATEHPVRPSTTTGEVTPLREESKRQFLVTRAEGLRTIILLFVVISFGMTVALAIEIVVGESQLPAHGGVASNNEICSDLGVMQLKKGGSAVDAAITAMLCNTVVQPQSGGLGGGGVMIVHELVHNKTVVFDFREVAPAKLTKDLVSSQPVASFLRRGGLSVGVPGEIKGMYEAHKMFGKLSWANLFAPIIKLAEDGFKVDKKLANDILRRKVEADADVFVNFRKVFYKDGDKIPYAEGDTIVRKDLAEVMRKLSKEGPDVFYNGSLATDILMAIYDAGGIMTPDDLHNYSVKLREPLIGSFNGYEILTVPAPFSGSLLLYMLNDFETTKSESLSREYFFDLAENLKKAFKCRDKLGDPMNFPEVVENEKIIANKTFGQHFCDESVATEPEDHGTAHVSVIDKDELLVSSTTSLNFWFGSLVVTKSGIVLNNEMADFAHPSEFEAKFNQVGPGKRPLSSMIPTIVHHNGKPCFKRISIGGINGTRIVSSVAQTLNNLLSFNMNVKDAVVSQKMYCSDARCELEGGFSNVNDVAESLTQKGTETRIVSKKLALIGVVTKKNADVESYADESLFAKGVAY